jgi:hypothetical protein
MRELASAAFSAAAAALSAAAAARSEVASAAGGGVDGAGVWAWREVATRRAVNI